MSSCNKNNLANGNKKRMTKKDLIEYKSVWKSFVELGQGYAWIMINFETLSKKNKEIFFSLENEIGEENILFVKCNYIEFMNSIRKFFRLKQLTETFSDEYSDIFEEKQILLMYNNKYPRRSIFIRMSIDENTISEEVEEFFENVISKLETQ